MPLLVVVAERKRSEKPWVGLCCDWGAVADAEHAAVGPSFGVAPGEFVVDYVESGTGFVEHAVVAGERSPDLMGYRGSPLLCTSVHTMS